MQAFAASVWRDSGPPDSMARVRASVPSSTRLFVLTGAARYRLEAVPAATAATALSGCTSSGSGPACPSRSTLEATVSSAALEAVKNAFDEMVEHRPNGMNGRLCVGSLKVFALVDRAIPSLNALLIQLPWWRVLDLVPGCQEGPHLSGSPVHKRPVGEPGEHGFCERWSCAVGR